MFRISINALNHPPRVQETINWPSNGVGFLVRADMDASNVLPADYEPHIGEFDLVTIMHLTDLYFFLLSLSSKC